MFFRESGVFVSACTYVFAPDLQRLATDGIENGEEAALEGVTKHSLSSSMMRSRVARAVTRFDSAAAIIGGGRGGFSWRSRGRRAATWPPPLAPQQQHLWQHATTIGSGV